MSKGSPLLALLGFIVLPLVWSLPEALVTAGVWCCVGVWVGGGVGGGVEAAAAQRCALPAAAAAPPTHPSVLSHPVHSINSLHPCNPSCRFPSRLETGLPMYRRHVLQQQHDSLAPSTPPCRAGHRLP